MDGARGLDFIAIDTDISVGRTDGNKLRKKWGAGLCGGHTVKYSYFNLRLNSIFPQDFAALALDAAHVVSQAVNREPCSQMNGSAITSKDTDAMLTCIREVQYCAFNDRCILYFKCVYHVYNRIKRVQSVVKFVGYCL